MQLRREDLTDHLKRISCGGQITQAIFSGAFRVQAMTPDQLLIVIAPEIADTDPLEDAIGVADLNLFLKALGMLPGSEDDVGVDVRVEDHRLVIDEPGRGCVRMLTARPNTIETRVADEIVQALLAEVGSTVVPLGTSLVAGIRNAFSGLSAGDVEMVLGPMGGMIRVGDSASHLAEFPNKDLRAPEPYAMNFGKHLISVLSTVDPEAVMYIAGPSKALIIQDGEYYYLLSPRSVGASVPAKREVKPPRAAKKAATA